MTRRKTAGVLSCALASAYFAAGAFSAQAEAGDNEVGARPGNDYPTVGRVEYVQECMRDHPGPRYEMLYKCACALDRIAEQLPYDQYVQLWTAANAMSIGGERGGYLRDAQSARDMAATFRSIEQAAQQRCFLRRDD